MKPEKLVMSAFGPFAEEVIIDFTRLGNTGLYLVTGDTGAGKTTIFDAISFALYGEASGEYRDSNMFRSKYAKDDRKTFVELTFVCQGKRYIVCRNPEYARPKDRGEGMTLQKADAVLKYPDERQPVTKISEVNKAIKEIIGLDRKQFSQIAMLAQGEFRKLLMSSTEAKQKIFRDIFATENYEKLQDRIKKRYLQMKSDYEQQNQRILQYIESLQCAKDFDAQEELERYQTSKQLFQKDEFDVIADKLILIDREKLDQIDVELEQLELSAKELDTQIGVARERRRQEQELQRICEKLTLLHASYTEKMELAKQAEEAAKDCDKLSVEIALIGEKLEDYKKHTTLKEEIATKKKEIRELEKRQGTRQNEINQCIQMEKELGACLELNKDAEKQQIIVEQKLELKRDRINQIENLEKQQNVIIHLEEESMQARQQYRMVKERCEQLQIAFRQMEQLFYDAQAGILAETLQEGQPCPVCGSIEHPTPAVKTGNVATKEELEQEKQQLENVEKQREQASLQAGKYEQQIHSAKLVMQEQIEKVFPGQALEQNTLQQEHVHLQEQISELLEELENCKKGKNAYETAYGKLPDISDKRKILEQEYQNTHNDIAVKNADISHLIKALEVMKSGLRYESEEAAKSAIRDLQTRVNALQKAKQNASEAVIQVEKERQEAEGQKTVLSRQLEGNLDKSLEELESVRERIYATQQEQKSTKDILLVRYRTNQDLIDRIHLEWSRFLETERQYQVMKMLSETANGEITGKDKIKLETYIQTAYFDRVLDKANVRFLGMTGGQYELVRKVQASNQRSQTGLELNVYDYYTSSERPVQTLSGGETFMASLSLALGLADEIQEAAGGIRLDTLFVDEGFGSLDDDTLRRAMEELNKLTDGNRLVGIISHVTELQNQVDKQLVVMKESHEGSSVKIIV